MNIQKSKYWQDKFIRWFYQGELADQHSADIMGEIMQKSIDELEAPVKEYIEAGLASDETCAKVINDYESAKEILKTGMAHEYTKGAIV